MVNALSISMTMASKIIIMEGKEGVFNVSALIRVILRELMNVSLEIIVNKV
jgi:hypothetical protein